MKFLDDEGLSEITSTVDDCELHDCILHGKLEAYSCKRVKSDKKFAQKLQKTLDSPSSDAQPDLISIPNNLELSRRSPSQATSDTKLTIDFITTLNASFPDYDFAHLTQDNFVPVDLTKVRDTVNSTLIHAIESEVSQGFCAKFWGALNRVIELDQCDAFEVQSDDFHGESPKIWVLDYFWFNKKLKKIAYLHVSATNKMHYSAFTGGVLARGGQGEEMEDEDDDPMGSQNSEQAGRAEALEGATGMVDTTLLDFDELGMVEVGVGRETWMGEVKSGAVSNNTLRPVVSPMIKATSSVSLHSGFGLGPTAMSLGVALGAQMGGSGGLPSGPTVRTLTKQNTV